MENFRDLGGNKSKDGRVVKNGLFFRSAHLNNLTDEDIDKLKSLNIKHIFDYRSDYEAMDKPTTEIEDIKVIRIPALEMPSQKDVQGRSTQEIIKEIFENNGAFNMIKDSYYKLPIGNQSYKKLVELIKNPNNLPILNHCTSGKDRTGVGCAIILMILGVSREDIIKDYLVSNDCADYAIDEYLKKNPEYKDVQREKLKHIFGVNKQYINNAFKKIDENYDTVEKYLYEEFNLSYDDIESIRNNYLQ